MNSTRHKISLGALALILCLSLPMGVLSLFAPTTTAEQVDAASSIVLARVSAMQLVPEQDGTVVELAIEHLVAGQATPSLTRLLVEGRPAVEVGDLVLALLGFDPPAIHGAYQVQKDPGTLEYVVVTPVTGMFSEGVMDLPPVPLARVVDAMRARRGLAPAPAPAAWGPVPAPAPSEGGETQEFGSGPPDDAYEPNDDLASATPVFPGPPKLVTGMPLVLTGLTITRNDVDFFRFDGPGLNILHAETRLPEGSTSLELDTLLGLFLEPTGELLAHDDDGGAGKYSRLVVPLEQKGPFAVAIESAPDSDLDFDGQEGQTTGPYELVLELEQASYLSNENDLVAGVSVDGSFIEDFIGFKEVGGVDVLDAGVPADGWGLEYEAQLPGGVSRIFTGAGDHLTAPDFTSDIKLISFRRESVMDGYGLNRHGGARSLAFAEYQNPPRRGVAVTQSYAVSLDQRTVTGKVELDVASDDPLTGIVFSRVLDVDMFGEGADTFVWRFDPAQAARAFPIDPGDGVGNPAPPAASSGTVTGDKQVAVVVDFPDQPAGTFEPLEETHVAFTLLTGFVQEKAAIEQATQNLLASGMTSWVIAVDKDPDTGLYASFGVGVTQRDP